MNGKLRLLRVYRSALVLMAILILFAMAAPQSSHAQAPTATPSLEDLQATVEYLNERIEINEDRRDVKIERELFPFYIWSTLCAIAVAGLGVTGYTLVSIRKEAKSYFQRALDGPNPKLLNIHIPDKEFARERDYLREIGFKNLNPYNPQQMGLSQLNGIVIFPARQRTMNKMRNVWKIHREIN